MTDSLRAKKLLSPPDRERRAIRLTFRPLAPETWNDFEVLFGERGACGGCWCMAWRQSAAEYRARKGAANKRAMRRLVAANAQLGILAYDGDRPVGWCAVAPREAFTRLSSSRVLRPVDDRSVWSIPCFFLAKEYRRRGLSSLMLKGVIAHCRSKGVRILEAYPVIPYDESMPAAFAWTGILSGFLKAGFREEKRWSRSRPIVRCYLRGSPGR